MKDKFLLVLLASIIFTSCSSVYRSGQTPDDVYYSPTREVTKTEDNEEEERKKIEEQTASSEDQYLKMKVRNRYRWTRIDDYDYWNDTRYNTGCHCTCNPPMYGYTYYYPTRYPWYNNPNYPVIVYGPTKNIRTSTSGSNIKAFTNRTYNNTNNTGFKGNTTSSNQGSLLKRVFTSSGSQVDRSQRTFGGSSGSSSSTTTSSSAGGKSGGMNTSSSGGKSRGN